MAMNGSSSPRVDNQGYATLSSPREETQAPSAGGGHHRSGSSPSVDSPVDRAGLLSRLLFLWITPLINLGQKRGLVDDDLFPIGRQDAAERLCRDLERQWKRQLLHEKPSLLRACAHLIGRNYITVTGTMHSISMVIGFTSPFLLGKVIEYFSGYGTRRDAYLYTMGFVGLSVVRAGLLHLGIFVAQREVGMHLRVALTSLIHKKVLQLSHSSLLKITTGHIVNLVSTDVQRLDELAPWLSAGLVGIVASILAVALVWNQVGVSCLSGFGLVILNLLFQFISASLMAKYRDGTAKLTDKRIRFMNEILSGIQLIKMYVWEDPFRAIINNVRKKEIAMVAKRQYLWGFNGAIGEIGLHLIVFVIFATYVSLGNTLSASTVFVTLALMQAFRTEVLFLQIRAFNTGSEAMVAITRIQEFLLLVESNIVQPQVSVDGQTYADHGHSTGVPADIVQNGLLGTKMAAASEKCMVDVSNLTASWEKDGECGGSSAFSIRDLALSLHQGELVIAVGAVGAGKTSLLMAILGELDITSGHCYAHGDTGYAAQLSWMYSGSIRENILFGRKFEAGRYGAVLSACCLDKDIHGMQDGDQTLVGERGVKLSGGQKARIGLARAVYQNADVYLLDDPLSAVDAEVGRHIFEKCIRGLLKDKAVLLVTHQHQFLSAADRVLVLAQGRSLGTFTYPALLASGLDLADSLAKAGDESSSEQHGEQSIGNPVDTVDDSAAVCEVEEESEDRATGSVTWSHYWNFLHAGAGGGVLIFSLFFLILTQSSIIFSDWVLATWTAMASEHSDHNSSLNCSTEKDALDHSDHTSSLNCSTEKEALANMNTYYFSLWGIIVAVSVLMVVVRSVVLRQIFVRSSKRLHDLMLSSILKAPMLFFNSNPSGRILNRFAKDLNLLDILLPVVFYEFFVWFLTVMSFAVFISFTNPLTLITLPPLVIVAYHIRKSYVKTSRELRRLEAVARSPVFSQFSSSLQGLTTIRAANAQHQLQTKFNNLLDTHSRGWLCYIAVVRWLSSRMELMGSTYLIVIAFAALLVFDNGNISGLNAGTYGLSLNYQLASFGAIQWVIRLSAEVEDLMTSAERIFAYSKVEPETEPVLAVQPAEDWPQHGAIHGLGMSYSYSVDGPKVLKDLNFAIQGGEKIGIVGRTGAGKSSFINALFRLAPTSGKVMIDGVRLDEVPLRTMRQKLSIIPQDPVLYSGSVRYNLDPFNRHHDVYLWSALEMVQLKAYVSQLKNGLEAELTECGSNLSVGQRQLICLARALLNRNRILMIDEATANVDSRTDAIIQQTLRTHFKDCTVLTIAHRLHTIIDSDRIMVIDDGHLKEFGSPASLLSKTGGALATMAQSLGENEAQQLHATSLHVSHHTPL